MTESKPFKRADEVWIFLRVESGEEFLLAQLDGDRWLPLIAADEQRYLQMYEIASQLCRRDHSTVIVRHFKATSADVAILGL